MADIHFALFDTAIGRCGIAWAAGGIVGVQLPLPSEAQTRGRLKQRYQALSEAIPPAGVQIAIDRMIALMDGKPIDFADIDLDLSESPDFNREVYAIAREIPPGKTMTYGDIAKRLGGVELSRNVGQAMGQNPCPIIVPCHRVLASDGSLHGFGGGLDTKQRLLNLEQGQHQDFMLT